MKTKEEAEAFLPENLKYGDDYVNFTKRSTIICLKCKFKWGIIPRNVTKSTICRKCKKNEKVNEFQNCSEDKNQDNDIKIGGEGKNIKEELENAMNQIEESENYIHRTIDELLKNNRLHFNKNNPNPYPKNIKDDFNCICDTCELELVLSYSDIERGLLCDNCEIFNPKSNHKRCLDFSHMYGNILKLDCIFKKDRDDVDVTDYIWICLKGNHENIMTLSNIKKEIKEYGEIDWCSTCREAKSVEINRSEKIKMKKKRN